MTACCDRRREDGVVDRENVRRAVQGQYARLSPREMVITVGELMKRGMGLNDISGHLGYSRTQVHELQQRVRRSGGRR